MRCKFSTIVLCVGLISCDVGGVRSLGKCNGLKSLEPLKAKRDALRAISKGDIRLLGISGYTTDLPGVDRNIDVLVKYHGIKMIEGTSDAFLNGGCAVLNKKAIEYAKDYNLEILK